MVVTIDAQGPHENQGVERARNAAELARSYGLDRLASNLPETGKKVGDQAYILRQIGRVLGRAKDEMFENYSGKLKTRAGHTVDALEEGLSQEKWANGQRDPLKDVTDVLSVDQGLGLVYDSVVWHKLCEAMSKTGRDSEYVVWLREQLSPQVKGLAGLAEQKFTEEAWRELLRPERSRGKKGAAVLVGGIVLSIVLGNVLNSLGFLPKETKDDQHLLPSAPPASAPETPGPSPTKASTGAHAATMPAPYSPPTASPGEIASAERVEDGVCLSKATEKLLVTDCLKLGDITDGAKFKIYNGMEAIGKIDKNGAYDQGFSTLPKAYQEAFVEMINKDELVKAANRQVPIQIWQTSFPDSDDKYGENGEFDGADGLINFRFNTNPNGDDGLYETWGAVRLVGTHEATHYFFSKWKEDAENNSKTQVNLLKLSKLNRADLRILADKVYGKNRKEMLELTRQISEADSWPKSVMSPTEYERYSKNLDLMKQILEANDARTFEMLMIGDDDTRVYDATLAPTDLLGFESLSEETKDNLLVDTTFTEMTTALDNFYTDELETGLNFTTEGELLQKLLPSRAGHPESGLDERIASTVVLARTAPDKYARAISKLPSDRKHIAIEFLQALADQFKTEGLNDTYLDLLYVAAIASGN